VSDEIVSDESLLDRIRTIWDGARGQAARSVNVAHVVANWRIGQQLVEAEQDGKARAEYGARLLKTLSDRLSREYGDNFSVSALRYMRLFYLGYPNLLPIHHALRDEFDPTTWRPGLLHTGLSWTHYRTLLKVERREARDFYEIETTRSGWSARQLERQINSLLFERLLKSRDADGVRALATQGLAPTRPADALKDPYVLEFLDLPMSHRLVESRLEEALLSRLQEFLLELGSGFAFVGRQVRLTLDGDHFYPDLVFYHVRLKCYVIIDLKVDKLSHADLGQMQMYVNYYDREIVAADDNPTIGLILCTDKNDAMARYVLAERSEQIFASRYQLLLPDEATLRRILEEQLS
jgi:predicted nuclease of restriction endonuclease-like (RecB) superfamily